MSEPDPSLLDKALMEVADARELDETPLPPQPDWEMMIYRLDQIEQRLLNAHPRAGRDGTLAAFLRALRDEITPFCGDGS